MKIVQVILTLLFVITINGCFLDEKNENGTYNNFFVVDKKLPNGDYALTEKLAKQYVKEYKQSEERYKHHVSEVYAIKIRKMLFIEKKFELVQKLIDQKKINIHDIVSEIDFLDGKTVFTTFALKNGYDLNKNHGVLLTNFIS